MPDAMQPHVKSASMHACMHVEWAICTTKQAGRLAEHSKSHADPHLHNYGTCCGCEAQGNHTKLWDLIYTHIISDGADHNCNALLL